MNLIEQGIKKGLIKFDEDKTQITYVHQNKKRNYNNPEEKVQAKTFLSLILNKDYPVERIRQFPLWLGCSVCCFEIELFLWF